MKLQIIPLNIKYHRYFSDGLPAAAVDTRVAGYHSRPEEPGPLRSYMDNPLEENSQIYWGP